MKRLLLVLLTVVLAVSLTACGGKSTNGDKKVIKVGASPVPHTEILEQVKPLLEKQGYTLEIVEFKDYVTPNTALSEGQIDANFFQHVPYLKKTVEEMKYDLDYTVKVHLEPMGLYSKKITNLEELKSGSKITIPNDPTNAARALRVLEAAGLIKVKAGDLVTELDITENPKNLKIVELDSPQLPRTLTDVDASVINTNFALEAGLNPTKDALTIESKDSPYANVLAVKTADKDKPYIKALSEALNSPEIKKFIEEEYKGSIIPAF